MLFLLLGLEGRGEVAYKCTYSLKKPTIVFDAMYVKRKKKKKHSESRCGAMKSQPTQTYADNQNKYAAKVFCTYTLE